MKIAFQNIFIKIKLYLGIWYLLMFSFMSMYILINTPNNVLKIDPLGW